ncbi:SDR family NAD(P)-dependent oxidoreductase [Xenorhabdus bovienii]|uniref:Short chain dehydrogenase n=1 Tax=Xenorhabdus bovienii str. kraussei Becker Underwood TaxID=1398204 RepID=A0A077PRB3_XENBV|nr:glucose 1-dehydrogenase [Xenorhabdus bovienii]CDH26860.1 Short chain dehydrogenase [Xenorhabdus bovienii str. kraussei Becker Underwood]
MNTTKKPIILITGALTGIGRATAFAFADEGATVVVSGRNKDIGQTLATELQQRGTKSEFIFADIRYEKDISNLIEQVASKFGQLDIAVNNAGTEGKPVPIVEETTENYANVFDTNVLGVLLSMKHELRLMKSQGHGSIINISSMLGKTGAPGASVYSASKHAVEGFTKSAALEAIEFGVRVNAVAPGGIATDMLTRWTGGKEENKTAFTETIPSKRAGTPEEIAQTIIFVASNKVPYLTGQSIVVDGGKLA